MEARSSRRRLFTHGGRALTLTAVIMLLGQGATAWQIETVDDGDRMFTWMSEQSVVLDATGNPHLAYGGDHLYYTWYDGERWHYEIADCSDSVGAHASLSLDAAGTPHISYIDSASFTVKYAHKTSPEWLIETVDEAGEFSALTSLEVDSSGHPHVCYIDELSLSLRYAHRDSLGWTIEVVAPALALGVSLDLDSSSQPHVAYVDHVSGDKCAYAWRDETGWHTELVTSPSYYVEFMPSIEVDSLDRPHLTWIDMQEDLIKYAVRTDTGWQVETVHHGYFGNTSLELNGQGYPHVVYDDSGLAHSYRDGSGWHTQVIDTTPHAGEHASLALNSNGWPCVTYLDDSEDRMRYARWNGSTWEIWDVDYYAGDVGSRSSLALTSAGQPFITYEDSRRGYTLHLAWPGPSGWQVEAIVTGATGSSLQVDAADRPHVSYNLYWPPPLGLMYACKEAVGWQFELVSDQTGIGTCSSVKLDSVESPHIAIPAWWEIRYANRSSGTWNVEAIDAPAEWPEWASLELDSLDQPRVAYGDRPDDDLRYAWKSEGGWSVEDVDVEGSVGFQASLSLGPDDRPHIAYLDESNYDLKYAERAPSGWLVSTIDAAGRVGFYPSIVVDDGGWPHIAYLDGTNGNLKYAYRAPLSWHIEVIDSAGAVGGFPSLVLDDLGRPHISYYDSTNGALKYAWMDGPIELNLSGSLEGNELTLTWAPAIGTECWVYGTANEAFFVPGMAPDFEHRLAVLPQGTITWASASGVGDPANNWTYLVIAVDTMDQELCRSNRVGEFDFDADTP